MTIPSRTRRYVLDLETQGLRTTRYDSIAGFPARSANDPLHISQFSMRDAIEGRELFKDGGYTDIITRDMLDKHKITSSKELLHPGVDLEGQARRPHEEGRVLGS